MHTPFRHSSALSAALWLACVAVTTSGYQPLASPRLAARRRSALVVLQEQPETDAADENAMEPEGGWGVDNLMEMMETAESEAAPAAAPAPPAAPPVEESSYLATEKAKYAGASGASAGDGDGDTRLAVPSFFGKREEEKPGAARGKEGLNEQGYDPYDPSAANSSHGRHHARLHRARRGGCRHRQKLWLLPRRMMSCGARQAWHAG